MVAKIARLTGARQYLEVGGADGYTANLVAENTTETELTVVDIRADHGGVFADGPHAGRIKRLVGDFVTLEVDSSYDLIYIDADHTEAGVRRESARAFELLRPGGVILWHDYANSFWLQGLNRVPEVLLELSAGRTVYGDRTSELGIHVSSRGGPTVG